MDLKCNYYERDIPKIGEVVTILMSEPDNDIISAKILEYPKLLGIMQIADLTSKKKIRSVRQYLSKKPVPAEVSEIDEKTKIVSLTRKYLRESEGLYYKFYQEKTVLLNFVKNVKRDLCDDEIVILVKTIIHPTMSKIESELLDDTKPPLIFDSLKKLYDENRLPDYGKYNDEMKKILEKIFAEKPCKNVTKFSLMCSVSVENIITLFQDLNIKYPKIKFTLESSPEYSFETFGLESEEKNNHLKIINFIKEKCKEKNITFKL